MSLAFASRYPFTSEAKALVAARSKLSYEEIDAAKERVRLALTAGELPLLKAELDAEMERQVFSYAGARVIVACLQSKYFRGRYAVAESKRAGKYMEREDDATLSRVAAELGMRFTRMGEKEAPYTMRFPDYLRFVPKDVKYKLVNKPLANGNVLLTRHEFLRVLEEGIRGRIEETFPSDVSGVPAELAKAAEEVRKALPKEEAFGGKVVMKEGEYPPCVTELITRLRSSENLPHSARWFLAVFLLNTGMTAEDVITLFRTAPDFDERTTRYQVEYIAKKEYTTPACVSVDSYGVCVAECRIGSPINFGKGRRRAAAAAEAAKEAGNAAKEASTETAKEGAKNG